MIALHSSPWAVAILLGALIAAGCGASSLHQPVDRERVEQVELWGGAPQNQRAATPEEVDRIITWFNSAIAPRENRALVGPTPAAGIRIGLKSGETISIWRSGADFEVGRKTADGYKQYWLKQPELRTFLDRLAVPASP